MFGLLALPFSLPLARTVGFAARELLAKANASALEVAFCVYILKFFNITAEGMRRYFHRVATNQHGGQLGSIGNDLPAVQRMIFTEPLILPLRGDFTAESMAIFFLQSVRDLIEYPI